MKRAEFDKLRPRMMVWDRWYPDKLGQGYVKKVERNHILISFPAATDPAHTQLTYDRSHVNEFLMRGNVMEKIKDNWQKAKK